MIQGNIQVTLQVVRTAVCYTLGGKKKCVKDVYFPIQYKWQGWNENARVSMKIYYHLRNPIIRHSGRSIWEKLPLLRVIITIQHANCFSICRLCFQGVLWNTTALHLDCSLMRTALIKDGRNSDFAIDREALSQALTFGNNLVSRLLFKYYVFQDHSRNHHIHSLSLRINSA